MSGRQSPTIAASGNDSTDAPSAMHLGRRAFIAGTAGAIAGAALLSDTAGAVEPGASYFVPMVPVRACDTREGTGYRWLDGSTIRVGLGDYYGIPREAVAVVLTVTGVNLNNGGNWISVYPAGTAWPGTASSNAEYFFQAVANLVTVKLGRGGSDANGAVDVRSLLPTHVVVDVAGYYLPASGPISAGRFEFINPFRVLDTRFGGKPRADETIVVNLNGRLTAGLDVQAVVANVTVVETEGGGFITSYPLGSNRPLTSILNYGPGEVRGGAVVAKLGSASGVRGFNLYTMTGTHLVVDIAGFVTGPNASKSEDGLFVPVEPQRLLDTRDRGRRVWPGGTATFGLPSAMWRARAVAMNLTATATIGPGYFTTYAAQTPRQFVSSLNAVRAGQTVGNHAFTKTSNAGIACFSQSGAHIVADVTGWYTGGPETPTTPPPIDPPPPGGPIPWIVQIPRIGLNQWVFDGDAKQTVDAGHSWHWSGTGLVGQGANSVLFGHRTEHGGPYRNVHLLAGGDLIYIYTSDGRRYTYQVAASFITSKYSSEILEATRWIGGETISLVACSKTNRLPTSLEYRLIVTGQLVGWDDLG